MSALNDENKDLFYVKRRICTFLHFYIVKIILSLNRLFHPNTRTHHLLKGVVAHDLL
jgi:hypothetical protein